MSKAQSLREVLDGGTELITVGHNNPDPDCLASALALDRIAEKAGIEDRRILYGGDISHQQNRAFVNLLELGLEPFDVDAVRDRPDGSLLAFVDHSVPGENNEVPAGTPVDVVVDHHPAADIDARFVDHREEIGATATIMAEYVRELEAGFDSSLATALLFAIRRETLGFLRGVTRAEYDAAGTLHEHADRDTLRRLSNPSVSGATVDAIADAIENRSVRGAALISHVGRTSERDALPQAADYLATLEGVETSIVFGIVEDTIQLSGRSSDPRIHVGDALREAFGDVGSAGGHREMGGGQIPLGIFADAADGDRELIDIVDRIVTRRLVASLKLSDEGTELADEREASGEPDESDDS